MTTKMNKKDFIDKMMAKDKEGATFTTKAQAARALEAVLETIGDALAEKEDVQFIGFGTFRRVEKPAHDAFSPRTRETVHVGASATAKFSVSKTLKDKLMK